MIISEFKLLIPESSCKYDVYTYSATGLVCGTSRLFSLRTAPTSRAGMHSSDEIEQEIQSLEAIYGVRANLTTGRLPTH
jgi:hypothetical protein